MVRHYPLRKPQFFIFSTLKCAAGRKFGRHFGRGRGVQSAVSVWPASCFLNSERLDDQFGTSSKIMNSNVEITLLSCAHRRIRKRFGTFQSLGEKQFFTFRMRRLDYVTKQDWRCCVDSFLFWHILERGKHRYFCHAHFSLEQENFSAKYRPFASRRDIFVT